MAAKDESSLRRRTTASVEKEGGGEEKPTKRYREKPRYPPIADMLAFGAPEEQGKPKTWLGTLAGPVILAILFFISWLIFESAPHHLSKGHERKGFAMNQKPHLVKKQKAEMERMMKEKADLQQKKPKVTDAPPQTKEAVEELMKKNDGPKVGVHEEALN